MIQQPRKLITLIAGLGLAWAGATAALAGPDTGKRRGGWSFEKVDTNGDGFIDKDELRVRAQEGFERKIKRIDANADGIVTEAERAEMIAKIEARGRTERARRMAERAPQGDMSVDEMRLRLNERMERRFARMDQDEDGRVSNAEFEAAKARHRERRSQRWGGEDGARGD